MICAVALWFVFPAILKNDVILTSDPDEIHLPPEISRRTRFLGSSGTYSGDFSHGDYRVLSSGPGQIVGAAMVDSKPLAGLRLRFALNGDVMSQWATTGAAGHYEIGVPYGKYLIDGFDLDTETANSVLAGKIEHPQNPISSGTFEVAAGAPGHGLKLEFVDPVVLDAAQHVAGIAA